MAKGEGVDIVDLFVIVIKFIRKNFLLLAGFTVIGVALGIWQIKIGSQIYVTDIIVKSKEIISPTIIEEICNNFQHLINVQNTDLQETELEKIRSDFEKVESIRAVTNIKDMVKLNIRLNSPDVDVDGIQNGIMLLLSKNNYIQNVITERKHIIEKQMEEIQAEKLEAREYHKSLIRQMQEGGKSGMNTGFESTLSSLNMEYTLQKELMELNTFQVIKTAHPPTIPLSSSYVAVIIFGISFMILGIISGAVISVYKEARSREDNSK